MRDIPKVQRRIALAVLAATPWLSDVASFASAADDAIREAPASKPCAVTPH